MNIWGMNMDMLILEKLGMLGSVDRCNIRSECFDRCNVSSECGNKGILGMNDLISAI